ncbi:hypothetical protein Tco_0486424 [Tanacetum coccineum]
MSELEELMKEQLLPVMPHLYPYHWGYNSDSDPEEDDERTRGDPPDYPADGGDNDDNESSTNANTTINQRDTSKCKLKLLAMNVEKSRALAA